LRRNASLPSSESRSIVHLPMVQRRYVIALLLPFVARAGASGNQDNRSLQGGASSPDLLEEAAFSELLLYGVLLTWPPTASGARKPCRANTQTGSVSPGSAPLAG